MKTHIILLFLAAGISHAATLTTSTTIGFDETLNNVGTPTTIVPESQFVTTVDAFDGALGILESITISFSFSATFSGSLGATGGGASASYGGDLFVSGISIGGTGGGGGTGGAPEAPFSTSLGLNAPFSVTITPDSDPALFAALQSAAPVSFSWNTGVSVSPGGTTLTTANVTGEAIATVEYSFTPVPEPASTLLTLVPGLLLLRRRR